MENFYKRSELLFTRFDKYFDSVNSKGTLYLAINTFFIGAVMTNIDKLSTMFEMTEEVITFIILFLSLCLASTVFVLLAINPFLNSGTKNGSPSSIFFYGSIAKYEKEVFIRRLQGITEEELSNDVGSQIYCLAEGLCYKYSKLKWAGWCILFEFIMIVPITILLTIHLKK